MKREPSYWILARYHKKRNRSGWKEFFENIEKQGKLACPVAPSITVPKRFQLAISENKDEYIRRYHVVSK